VAELGALLAIPIAVLAAASDVRSGTIPNRLTYPAVMLGLAVGAWPGAGPSFASSALGLAIALLPALALFAAGAIGGGDAKLLAAIGALVGWPLILEVLFFSVVAGGALALCTIVAKGRTLAVLRGFWVFLPSLFSVRVATRVSAADLRVPFAPAALVGVLWAVFAPGLREVLALPGLGG
jgi:prepilin peptidase CpaA